MQARNADRVGRVEPWLRSVCFPLLLGSGARVAEIQGLWGRRQDCIQNGWFFLRRVSHFRSEAPPALEAGAAVTASEDLVRGASDWEKMREKAVMCIGGRTDPRVPPLNPATTLLNHLALACGVRATVALD